MKVSWDPGNTEDASTILCKRYFETFMSKLSKKSHMSKLHSYHNRLNDGLCKSDILTFVGD